MNILIRLLNHAWFALRLPELGVLPAAHVPIYVAYGTQLRIIGYAASVEAADRLFDCLIAHRWPRVV